MSEIRENWKELSESLREQRDELRVQLHLAKSEVKDEWHVLEKKWERIERRLQRARDEASDVGDDVEEAWESLVDELKDGYRRVRKSLKAQCGKGFLSLAFVYLQIGNDYEFSEGNSGYYPEYGILLLEGGHSSDMCFSIKTGESDLTIGNPEYIISSPKNTYRLNGSFGGQECISYFFQKKRIN